MPFHCGVHLPPPPEAVSVVDGDRWHVDQPFEGVPEFFFRPTGPLEASQFRIQLIENGRQLLSGVAHWTVSLDGGATMFAAPLRFPEQPSIMISCARSGQLACYKMATPANAAKPNLSRRRCRWSTAASRTSASDSKGPQRALPCPFSVTTQKPLLSCS